MLEIRRAEVDDANEISELVRSLAREHIAPTLGEGGLEALLRSMDRPSVRQRLGDGWPTFCAVQQDDLAGVVMVKPPAHRLQTIRLRLGRADRRTRWGEISTDGQNTAARMVRTLQHG